MPIIQEILQNEHGEPVTINIEVDESQVVPYSPYADVRGDENAVMNAAQDIFGSSMNLIRTCAEQIVHTIQKVDAKVRPAELEVQLAIKLDSTVGAILAKASAGAQLQVTMKWVKKDQP